MSTDDQPAPWECGEIWSRFETLEARHQRLQAAYDAARRALDATTPREADKLRQVWCDFHESVTQLGSTIDEIARLHAEALARPGTDGT